ncbi:MAG: NifB/NifX family molybdenum-iron cluster-binding protein [Candidatus Marinimicrobia bacterium]|nr:NifB/NifX family molybdenum-iron cluster-binding protein [Candidatus Neomarinimicrobiota bacterium]MCF7827566.1 NifB/NifX family molybdenum-iron cluster-binding protein [Candidatus Neomarinimicrobiota bacterium]MCF7881572.1 NifB/NifX family molybdenum-iron cluster-binding protein [Candidatus Neomarinimicrobiota bacterium]
MKVCIPTKGETSDATVDSTFGRCQYLLFAETESGVTYQHENKHREANSGVGTQVAQAVVAEGAEAVISQEIGPKAQKVLQAGNVKGYHAEKARVQEVLDLLKQGKLEPLY